MEEASSSILKISSPRIQNGDNDRIHLFWTQSDSPDPNSLGKEIFYSVRQENQWSPPTGVLTSPAGKAEQVNVAINPTGQLFAVWSGGHGGEIYFSQADSDQAFVASSWSEPIELPAPVPVGSSPEMVSVTMAFDGSVTLRSSHRCQMTTDKPGAILYRFLTPRVPIGIWWTAQFYRLPRMGICI